MRSVNLQKAHEIALEYERTRQMGTDLLDRSVVVIHGDGSVFAISNAVLVQFDTDDGRWLSMFAEHQDTQTWSKDDLTFWAQYGPQQEPHAIEVL